MLRTINPLRYSSIKTRTEVHGELRFGQCEIFYLNDSLHVLHLDIGEVWANMLHNVYAALVGKLGFDANAHTNAS